MHVDYDSWKLASPPEADQGVLTDIVCNRCDWEGDVVCFIAGNNLTWECPECGHEHHEDPIDRFGPDPDDRRD
jgi:hypothetical protein